MGTKRELIEFNKSTFLNGLKSTYGKIPVNLEISLEIDDDKQVAIGLYAGIDRMYKIDNINSFLNALCQSRQIHFGKKFVFEPSRMYFKGVDMKLLDVLIEIQKRHSYGLYEGESWEKVATLKEHEAERLFDVVWNDIRALKFCNNSVKYRFENDVNIKIKIEKQGSFYVMELDYSEYGDFEPITINFAYVFFKDAGVIAKLLDDKRELFENIHNFKNESNLVLFKIGENQKKMFKNNFFDKYCKNIEVEIDKSVKSELDKYNLLSRVYFDIAPNGIASKVEFCYGEKVINPLDDATGSFGHRDTERERQVLGEIKDLGMKQTGKLFYLEDREEIMDLLTDNLGKLKKIAQVYYSEDFRKLHVYKLDNLGINLSLSEDDSLIHMGINLENVTDEELMDLIDAIKKRKRYFRLKNGSIINLANVESERLINLINSMDIDKSKIKNGVFEIPLSRCVYIDNYLKSKGIENVEIEPKLKKLIKDISTSNNLNFELNGVLKDVLRDYQVVGVNWLKSLSRYRFGGILADDMGLGKTLQVLAFIASEEDRTLPCMVVAPTSVILNWKTEAKKFVPEMKVLVVTGMKDIREKLISSCDDYNLVVTSYGALRNDIGNYSDKKFSYVFIDEAQNIKNPNTLNANTVKTLRAKCCFALTGTPIENGLTELWSIFDFVMPGYLYSLGKFKQNFEEPIVNGKDARKKDDLSKLIAPFILRRLKKDVLKELPEKIETNHILEMTVEQKKLYVAYFKKIKNEFLVGTDINTKSTVEILSALTRLRQICAHPGTFLEDYDGGSGKLDAAMEIISEAMDSGHSVLLFSQFTKMLKIIRCQLENENLNYYYLDGTMKAEERLNVVDDFNSDKEAVFLISLKAGGTGLNLTKADIVIHFDPWWNPAVEDQASDRTHRIGQKNVVQVYKLLTEGTIEEKIMALQEKKKDLIDSVITQGENFINSLGEDEIRELFELERKE